MRILRLNRRTLASVRHLGFKLERTKMHPTDRLFNNKYTPSSKPFHVKISFYIPLPFYKPSKFMHLKNVTYEFGRRSSVPPAKLKHENKMIQKNVRERVPFTVRLCASLR